MNLYKRSLIILLSICSILLSATSSAASAESKQSAYKAANSAHTLTISSPTLINPAVDSGLTIHSSPINQKGSVKLYGGFLFYSNNPECVNINAFADNGCWLNRADVTGYGQVYTWHKNVTLNPITSVLYINNPNKSGDIIIEINQYGMTNGYGVTDVAAWDSYLESKHIRTSTVVKPGQWIELFKQTVAPNYNFGIVAAINVTDRNGYPAKAVFEDLIYYKDNFADHYAKLDDNNGCRGLGSSYKSTLTFDPLIISSDGYSACYIGASNDSLHGKDLVKIKGYDKESLLEGNYGQIMTINVPIKNVYRDNQNFGIFIGSIGGHSFPFVRLQKNSFISLPVKPFKAYDMIQTGKMAFNSNKTVSFTLVIPALSSTPLVIGVHTIP